MQALLENQNTQQRPPTHNKSDFKVPNKYVRTLKITQQITRIYLHPMDTKNYQRMMILKTRVIPRIMLNQRSLLGQTKPTLVKEIILRQKNLGNPIIHRHKNTQQHLKKYDNLTVILGDLIGKDLKG